MKTKLFFPIGTQVTGVFSCLPFSGFVIGYVLECVKVKVLNPHMNLPVGTDVDGELNILCFHPSDKNVFVVAKVQS
jgi:hypothetical protein